MMFVVYDIHYVSLERKKKARKEKRKSEERPGLRPYYL